MSHSGKGRAPIDVVVAVSGGGRSLANLIERANGLDARYRVTGVISSRPDAYANQIAADHGLPLFVGDFAPKAVATTAARLVPWLEQINPDWIALAGFLKPFPLDHRWRENVVNIHPALLPKFGGRGMYGIRVHEAVVTAGEPLSGATLHFVNEHYDEGQVIAQIEVPLASGLSPAAVATLVFEAECDLYPRVLNGLATGDLPLADGPLRYRLGADGRLSITMTNQAKEP